MERGGAGWSVSYPRYRTLQTPETQPSSRGREHRRDRGAECGPRPFLRSAHRRRVRAGGGKCRGCARGPTTTAARGAQGREVGYGVNDSERKSPDG